MFKKYLKRYLKNKLKKIVFNIIEDRFDARDYRYTEALVGEEKLPERMDLRPNCSPVEHQETIGSCGPNAIAGAMEYNDIMDGSGYTDVSRLFIYYNARERMGTVNEDSGVQMRELIKAVAQYGACAEVFWPYNVSKFKNRPSEECYIEGSSRRIKEYSRISKNLTYLKHCLYEGYPIIFGMLLHSSFTAWYAARNGMIHYPWFFERPVGGHAMEIVGYDDKMQRFIVRNSWGEQWGDGGYCYIKYKHIMKYGFDFWTVRK